VEEYQHLTEKEIVHGKDTLNVIKEIAKRLGKSKENIEAVFWMSFNKERIIEHKNLKTVLEILK
jgi:predicted nuclease of restriction endonuclease-like RecB superfamily